jgi:hypothetical protein
VQQDDRRAAGVTEAIGNESHVVGRDVDSCQFDGHGILLIWS